MITKFKIFESKNKDELEIGDWVLCEEDDKDNWIDIGKKNFIKNSIGLYIGKNPDYPYKSGFEYIIYYENSPGKWLENNQREMKREEIKYWSKNKEDLESIIILNKYNL